MMFITVDSDYSHGHLRPERSIFVLKKNGKANHGKKAKKEKSKKAIFKYCVTGDPKSGRPDMETNVHYRRTLEVGR
jgi:hypothetical protein